MIILYTQDGCGHCEEVKETLVRECIPFEEREASELGMDDETREIVAKVNLLPVLRVGNVWFRVV